MGLGCGRQHGTEDSQEVGGVGARGEVRWRLPQDVERHGHPNPQQLLSPKVTKTKSYYKTEILHIKFKTHTRDNQEWIMNKIMRKYMMDIYLIII